MSAHECTQHQLFASATAAKPAVKAIANAILRPPISTVWNASTQNDVGLAAIDVA
jgi:hypothetical protein